MATIVEARFITSAPTIDVAPPVDAPIEIAFMGRSNVGKSSLLNALTQRKGLAKSSATPGKTQLINFFDITYQEEKAKFHARFVDLPGFGYAKVSKSLKQEWQKNLTTFITQRDTIKIFIHLIDARHPNLAIDADVRAFLQEIVRSHQIILEVITKVDKLNQKELVALKKVLPYGMYVSNEKKSGIQVLNDRIFSELFGAYDAVH